MVKAVLIIGGERRVLLAGAESMTVLLPVIEITDDRDPLGSRDADGKIRPGRAVRKNGRRTFRKAESDCPG